MLILLLRYGDFLECGYVIREIKISLESFQQNLEYGIVDGLLEMLLEHPDFMFRLYVQLVSRERNMDCLILTYDLCKLTRLVFFVGSSTLCYGVVHELSAVSDCGFRHQNLCRQGENLKLAIDKCCLDLCKADCYDSLNFVFIVCDIVVRMWLLRVLSAPAIEDVFDGFHATKIAVMVRHLNLFDKREASCFEVLISFAIKRLKQFHSCAETLEAYETKILKQFHSFVEALEANETKSLKQFHSCVEAHMRLMEQSFLKRVPLLCFSTYETNGTKLFLKEFHSYVSAHMRLMEESFLKEFHSYVLTHMRLMEQSSLLIDVMERDYVLLDRDCAYQKDCAHLVKANSIQGNKVNNVDVVYTPWFNLKKTASMGVGQAGFHISKMVRTIRNRLNKTKVERTSDLRAEREAVNAAESAVIADFSAEIAGFSAETADFSA